MAGNGSLPGDGTLPSLPDGLERQVTAWHLPQDLEQEGIAGLPPRVVMILLLHMSYLRVQEYAGMLQNQKNTASSGPRGGLIGFRTGRAADGTIYATGEELRGLTILEAQERDRLARLARECHDLGITGDDV